MSCSGGGATNGSALDWSLDIDGSVVAAGNCSCSVGATNGSEPETLDGACWSVDVAICFGAAAEGLELDKSLVEDGWMDEDIACSTGAKGSESNSSPDGDLRCEVCSGLGAEPNCGVEGESLLDD